LRREGEKTAIPPWLKLVRRRQVESRALGLTRTAPQSVDPGADPGSLVNQIKPMLKEVNWDYALVERVRPDDLRTTLIPFNLGKAVLEGDPQQNLLLAARRCCHHLLQGRHPVSAEKQTRFIRLEGEFNAAGIYQISTWRNTTATHHACRWLGPRPLTCSPESSGVNPRAFSSKKTWTRRSTGWNATSSARDHARPKRHHAGGCRLAEAAGRCAASAARPAS